MERYVVKKFLAMALHGVWNMEELKHSLAVDMSNLMMERTVVNQFIKVVQIVQSMMDLEILAVDVRRSCRMERYVVKKISRHGSGRCLEHGEPKPKRSKKSTKRKDEDPTKASKRRRKK